MGKNAYECLDCAGLSAIALLLVSSQQGSEALPAGAGDAEAERTELRQREELRLRETETLLAVSRALSSTLDPTETMRRVAREIARALGADMVGAYLADAARENLWPVAGYHVPRDMLDAFRRFPIPIRNHPAIEEAWAHRRAVWTDDMPGDPRVDPESLRHFPHQSDLFVPIRVKDRPMGGFFVIWWTARRSFTEWEISSAPGRQRPRRHLPRKRPALSRDGRGQSGQGRVLRHAVPRAAEPARRHRQRRGRARSPRSRGRRGSASTNHSSPDASPHASGR